MPDSAFDDCVPGSVLVRHSLASAPPIQGDSQVRTAKSAPPDHWGSRFRSGLRVLIFAKHRHHEFESFSARDFNGSRTVALEPLQPIEISGKKFGKRATFGGRVM